MDMQIENDKGREYYHDGKSFKVGQFLFIPITSDDWEQAKIVQIGEFALCFIRKNGEERIISWGAIFAAKSNIYGSFQGGW